jgi:hypothetical protein
VDLHIAFGLLSALSEARFDPPLAAAEIERVVTSVARMEAQKRGIL